MDQSVDWITFRLGEERYCHRVEHVQEVLSYEQPTPVPSAPANIMGILNVRGEVVTVMTGRELLGLNPKIDEECKIITFKKSGEYIGMLVDEVDAIISFEPSEVDHDVSGNASDLLTGTVNYKDRLIVVMDFTRYCDELINDAIES